MAVLEKKRKFIRFLAILSALFVYLISIEPVKDLLLYPLEKNYAVTEKLNADAIVILGGGTYSLDSFTEDTSNRLLAGYRIYKKTKLPVIVSGGAVEGRIPDSAAMAEMLKKLGVESGKIIEETKSKDTAQNASYVSEICKEKNFKRVILITSAYHMERAVKIFKKTGLMILPYPADFKRSNHYNVYSFLPKFSNFAISSKAIREYIALVVT
ncbi:YdcF family protein [Thermodesulfovibrio sp. TK110]